jgi:hypothetical protein
MGAKMEQKSTAHSLSEPQYEVARDRPVERLVAWCQKLRRNQKRSRDCKRDTLHLGARPRRVGVPARRNRGRRGQWWP